MEETEDSFADYLQIISQKLMNVHSSQRDELNAALKNQYVNHLYDPCCQSVALGMPMQCQELSVTTFHNNIAQVFGTRGKKTK